MIINKSKTKVMINTKATERNIKMGNEVIDLVDSYIYLEQRVSLKECNQAGEIIRRIPLGWAAFGKHRNILKSNLPVNLKTKIFNQ